jgi:amidase
VLEAQLGRIAAFNPVLHAVVTLDEEGARRAADRADAALAHGEVWGPLHGVPLTLEDAHATAGVRSTWGGYPPFADHVPTLDSAVAARIKGAGAVLMGKTHGPTIWGDESVFPEINNPWNLAYMAGGSSTGPAVALAAGLTPLDVGLDTLGSIQSPAHCCGIFGLRPSEHRVPLTGSFFLDPIRKFRIMSTPGPMARNVEDLRLALRLLSGSDGRDPDVPLVPWREAPSVDAAQIRLAYATAVPKSGVTAEISAGTEALAVDLRAAGVTIEERVPNGDLGEQVAIVGHLFVMLASMFGAPQVAEGWSLEAYLTALEEREAHIAAWSDFFGEWDAFIAPAGPSTATRRGDEPPDDLPLLFSQVSGCPMVVVPLGFAEDGLPFGVQVIGSRWEDERLLAIADLIADVTGGFRPPPGY